MLSANRGALRGSPVGKKSTPQLRQSPKDIREETQLDQHFLELMVEVEQQYSNFSKHDKIRIEQWTKKLCQVTSNIVWKKSRNLYAHHLLQDILHGFLTPPFTKIPPDGPLNKYERASGLSVVVPHNMVGARREAHTFHANSRSPERESAVRVYTQPNISESGRVGQNIQRFQSHSSLRQRSSASIQEARNDTISDYEEMATIVKNEMLKEQVVQELRSELELSSEQIQLANQLIKVLEEESAKQDYLINGLYTSLQQAAKYLEMLINNQNCDSQKIKSFLNKVSEQLLELPVKNVSRSSISQTTPQDTPNNLQQQNLMPTQNVIDKKEIILQENKPHLKTIDIDVQNSTLQKDDENQLKAQNVIAPSQLLTPKRVDTDTANFLNYLDSYQRKTEKLKHETEEFLKNTMREYGLE